MQKMHAGREGGGGSNPNRDPDPNASPRPRPSPTPTPKPDLDAEEARALPVERGGLDEATQPHGGYQLARGDVRCAREEAAEQMGEVPREGLGARVRVRG